ncbi:MAG: hypothetical protein DWQ04_34385 [Chloroflexi bacterium]|nr:MAG: hypothetical protein DWQ04_34385 [Chloroflexota bacterium]
MQQTIADFFGDLSPFQIITAILSFIGGIYALVEVLRRVKVKFYPADSIGFVLSKGEYVSKFHLRCNLVNKTSKLGVVHRLEVEVRSPENKIYKFPWKLFYEYKPGAGAVQKETDPYPIAVMPKNNQTLFIEFEAANSVQSSEWILGRYKFKVIGWVNQKDRNSKPNLESEFHINIDQVIHNKFSQAHSGPTVYSVPVEEWVLPTG